MGESLPCHFSTLDCALQREKRASSSAGRSKAVMQALVRVTPPATIAFALLQVDCHVRCVGLQLGGQLLRKLLA